MNRDILHRIKSIRQTVQISSAQKLLAATQISRARKMLNESMPFHHLVSEAFAKVMLHTPDDCRFNRFFAPGGAGGVRRGLLVLSASRGLAGGYNSNVIRFAEGSLTDKPAQYVIALGKAREPLIKKGFPVDQDYYQPLDPPTMLSAMELAEKIFEMLEKDQIDCFDVVYTAFRSSVKLEVVERRLFPLDPTLFIDQFGKGESASYLIFEPNPERVIASTALKYLKGYLYGCIVHTWISELTSRVMAMDNAIRNGNDMLEELSLAYNRQRQAAITQEITEIVAGAAAMRDRN
jgi:F-type H+-transporting ATPase subunit gamma